MTDFKLENFRLPQDTKQFSPPRALWSPRDKSPNKKPPFLKGPICFRWITKASALPGKALHVGLAIWYLIGLKRTSTIKLAPSVVRKFGASRDSGYRALKSLEVAKLVSVKRLNGQAPIVTVLDIEEFKMYFDKSFNGTGTEQHE